ncbi:MAG: efflux RND transporter permease subunit [Oscillospiraceae bacterium]|nr:efflux RND transporter permease subunit [Oscillospiraceae bacterium]
MLAKFSVKKPLTVLVAVVLVLILGFVSFTSMTPDLLPNMDFPMAVLMTTYPGASPEEVETAVTKPLEQSMSTLENISTVTSSSSENYSIVFLEFSDNVNMDAISIDIREKISLIEGSWPDTVGTPYLMKINPNILPVMVAAVDLDGADTAELTSFLNDTLMNKLEGVAGVASISTSGAIEKQINVLLSQEKIDAVNAKMQAALADKFDQADSELADAKAELQNGKQELQNGHETLREEMGKAESEVYAGKAQLDTTDMAISAALEQAEEQLPALKSQKKSMDQLIATLNQLEAAQAAFDAQIAAIEAREDLTREQKDAAIAQITSSTEYHQVQLALEQIDAALDEMGLDRQSVRTASATLGQTISGIEDTMVELKDTQEELAEGKITLAEAIDQMNEKKAGAEWEIYSGLIKVLLGETSLDSAQQQLDDARSEAETTDVGDTLTMNMVSQILTAQNFSMPAGYITESGVDYLVRVGDKISDVEEMQNLMLFDPGIEGMDPVYLRDVADIFVSDNAAETYAKMGKNDGLILSFNKQSNYATAEVTENLQKRFAQLSEEFEGLHFTSLMDQGDYIHLIVNSVLENLAFGAVLAIIILFFFLRDIKPTSIIAVSIPVSVIFAIVLMYFSGVTLNMISLSGLAVGVGMLVDNSVVVIENIYRLRNKGYTAVQAAVSGASQVAAAITSSTLTTVCVFLPIVFVQGITRQLFTDMALTITYSLLASLVVALTVVPAMAQRTLRKNNPKTHNWFEKLQSAYEKALRWTLQKKWVVLSGSLVLLVLSLVWALSRGFSFMPSVDSAQISLTLQMPEDATLEDTASVSDTIIDRVSAIDGVETVGAMLSGGTGSILGLGGSSEDVTSVSMYILLDGTSSVSTGELTRQIEDACADLDGEIAVSGSSDMSSMMTAMSGSGVSINLYGDNLDQLQASAREIAAVLEQVKGVAEVDNGIGDATPELRITVDKQKAMEQNLTVAQVYAEIAAAMKKETASTTLNLENSDVGVVIVDGSAAEISRDEIENHAFTVKNADGEESQVLLKEIATFADTQSLSTIQRDAQRRYLTVSATLQEGYNVSLVTADAQKSLADYSLPAGFSMEFSGENQTIMESITELLKMLLMAVAFIYLIMVAQFQSLKSPLIVLFTIPLAFTGGLLGLLVCGMEISVISMIGFVMLAGIIVNNGIVLIDYVNQLRTDGKPKFDALVEAGATRLRPILMTTLTTVLGLSTMALGLGTGAQMMQPVAIVCIGGLLYATLMTLFVVPAMYDLLNKKELRAVSEDELQLIEE